MQAHGRAKGYTGIEDRRGQLRRRLSFLLQQDRPLSGSQIGQREVVLLCTAQGSDLSQLDIIPAVVAFSRDVCTSHKAISEAGFNSDLEYDLLEKLTGLSAQLNTELSGFEQILADKPTEDSLTVAKYYRDNVLTAMQRLRSIVDTLETLVGRKYWPFPSYSEMLYSV